MLRVSHADLVERLVSTAGTIVLLGGIDTGKTSFGLSVAEAGRASGLAVAYVDADISQSTIGPPTCLALKYWKGSQSVDLQALGPADKLSFVGSTSPHGHLVALAAGTARLVSHARQAGCDLIVVDTSGVISGVSAEILKYHKLDLIRPDAIVGFQRGEELEPLLGIVRRFMAVETTVLRVDSAVGERSVEERLAYREARLREYFQQPLSRWRVKTTVFMPTIPPECDLARLDGLVVGLEDGKGCCTGIGVLEYDHAEGVLRMVSPVPEAARGLRLGSVRITTEGKILGRVNLRELLGTD